MDCNFLYVVGQLRDGGLERQLYYLLRTIDRQRYKPHVVVWNFREDAKYVAPIRALGVPLYGLPGKYSRLQKMYELRGLVRRLKPKVVHSFSFHTNFGAWFGALGSDAVVTGSVRSEFSRSKAKCGFLLGRLCARWPRWQILNSVAAADSIRSQRSPFVPEHVMVVRNGVDLERYRSTPLPSGPRAAILGIGTFSRVKRWDRLIRAAAQLKQRRLQFAVKLVGDGPLRHELEEQVSRLQMRDCFEFVTRTDAIPTMLSESTMLVHTSESEGCPNVVMEAMACGRPLVATDAGDIPSLVEDGTCGFVIRRGDDEALTLKVETLLNDRALCRRMGEAGRLKAEREFSLSRLIDDTLVAYNAAGWKGF